MENKIAVIATVVVVGLAATFAVYVAVRPRESGGVAELSGVVLNFTYASPTGNGSGPLTAFYQGCLPCTGSVGSRLSFEMSPYDVSSLNCTLWGLVVYEPFELVSVNVTALPYPPQPAHPLALPVSLPAAVHGTSEWANLDVLLVLPEDSGTYALHVTGVASCP